ncbi:MAG: hypothetical protein VB778_06315 [Nitrospinaceae bacterium]
MNLKFSFLLCGLAGILYLIWPFMVMGIKVYIYGLTIKYGFYLLLALAGGGFYFWRRLKK